MRRALTIISLRLLIGLAVGQAFITQQSCSQATITAFSVQQYPGLTADGTPTHGNAGAIAAASYNYPLGSYVTVDGLGSYRVADRGRLGSNHVDILIELTRDALAFGRQVRQVCREGP